MSPALTTPLTRRSSFLSAPPCTAGTFPEPPKPGKGDLELLYQYANSKGLKTGDYDVIEALNFRSTCFTSSAFKAEYGTVFVKLPLPNLSMR